VFSRSLHARPVLVATGLAFALGALALLQSPVSATTSTSPSTAPSSWRYLTRSGSTLELDGKPWRFTGVNEYWLGLDDNVQDASGPTYPTHAAVRSGLASAAALGATVVRATTLGVSVGSPRSLEPTLNHFNAKAFNSIDYAVAEARHYGVRLMIPLTDEWQYYHGGKHTFTNWLGYTDLPGQNVVTSNDQRALEAHFYTDAPVIAAFHRYVKHLLNHVNPLTGLRLGSDPTIAIWETGNELWDAPPTWTDRIAHYIKKYSRHALVADGSAASGKDITETGYADRYVDIIDGHFYPTDTTKALSDADFTAAHGKAYVVGEYPLTGDDVQSWLSSLAGDPNVSGGLAWTLLPYLTGRTPEAHGDGYALHYPGADSAETAEDAAQQRFAQLVAGTG
jgi:mannan endo-1,4-beta-mannosidase